MIVRLRIGIGRRIGAGIALATAVLLATSGARACTDFRTAPSSRWSIAASPAGPVLLTPCGQPFFSLGVNAIDGSPSGSESPRAHRWERFAENRADWAAAVRQRLR